MTAQQVKGDVYSCLDPRGHAPEKPRTSLKAPRLTDLKGKNVWLIMRESFPNVMPEVHDELLRQAPEANVIWWNFDKQGPLPGDKATLEPKPDAAIAGVGY